MSTTKTIGKPRFKNGFLRKLLIVLAPIAVIFGFVIVTFIVVKANEKPKEKKRSFNTLAVMADKAYESDIQLSVITQGEVRPRTEIDLVPQVGGKIIYVSPNFIGGGIFKKGETLIRIEDADYQVSVVRASANVAQAEQVLVREIAEGEIAKRDYAELGRGEASALALRQPQRQQAEAALQAAKADLDNAKLQLTRTEVKAPFSGRVRVKNSDVGQFVSPGTRLGQIFSTDIVEIRLPLIDNDLMKIDLPIAYVAKDRASAPDVELSAVIAGQRRVWNGKIMRTDSAYDRQTRALFAIAEVFDPYGKGASENNIPLAPGLFVDATIHGKVYENVITFPRDGLRPDNEVFVVDDKGKAAIRKVEVLDSNADRAVLRSGVTPGELIVLSPLERSRIETPLKVLDVNAPETVLVTPPKPDWLVKREAEDAKTKAGSKKTRKWGVKKTDKTSERPLKKAQPDNEAAETKRSQANEDASSSDVSAKERP